MQALCLHYLQHALESGLFYKEMMSIKIFRKTTLFGRKKCNVGNERDPYENCHWLHSITTTRKNTERFSFTPKNILLYTIFSRLLMRGRGKVSNRVHAHQSAFGDIQVRMPHTCRPHARTRTRTHVITPVTSKIILYFLKTFECIQLPKRKELCST